MGACYDVTTPAASMIRQTLWAQKTGQTPAPKLCTLPRQRKHLSKTSSEHTHQLYSSMVQCFR